MPRHVQARRKEVAHARVAPKDVALEPLLRPSAVGHMYDHKIDAWFTFHIPGSTPNQVALRLFRATGIHNLTAPIMGFTYPDRKPILIVAGIEKAHYEYFVKHGELVVVNSRAELEAALKNAMKGCKTVATEYAPNLIATSHSIIPASLLRLLTSSRRVGIVSSGDLIQAQIAVLSPEGLVSHERTAQLITAHVNDMFEFIRKGVGKVSEYEAQQFLVRKFEESDLTCEGEPPIVAVNANAANPHYSPQPKGSAVIKKGDLILVDFWARENTPEAIYADLGWMAYVGNRLPPRYKRAFETLLQARDAATGQMQRMFEIGEPLVPSYIDAVARSIIVDGGYPDYPHSTGHSITTLVHGEGVSITKPGGYRGVDNRLLLPGCLVSNEPGIYIPRKFGMRVEADIYIDPVHGPRSTSEIQTEMVFI